jgi:hypothetical protein
MPIPIACPTCSKPVLMPEQTTETALLCPHCRQPLELPSAEMTEEASAEPVAEASPAEVPEAAPVEEGDEDLAFDASVPDEDARPKYSVVEWSTARTGLNLLAVGTIAVVLAQAANIILELAAKYFVQDLRKTPELIVLVLFLSGAVSLCGMFASFVGMWMAACPAPRSRLGRRGANAALVLTLVPVGVLALVLAIWLQLGAVLTLGVLAFTGLAAIVGTALYVHYLGDIAGHLGDRALAASFSGYLILLILFAVAAPIIFIGVYFVALIAQNPYLDELQNRPFQNADVRNSVAVQVTSLALFAFNLFLQVRFFELVRRLLGRLERVTR